MHSLFAFFALLIIIGSFILVVNNLISFGKITKHISLCVYIILKTSEKRSRNSLTETINTNKNDDN